MIGYLTSRSRESDASMLAALRTGLAQTGYVEGQNTRIEYRFAEGDYDRLTDLVGELVDQRVDLIVFVGSGAFTSNAAWERLRAARIPTVFNIGGDPVRMGLVASMNHPGDTLTGVSSFTSLLAAKNLGLLHELVPGARHLAMLADARSRSVEGTAFSTFLVDAPKTAAELNLDLRTITAGDPGEIDAAFATFDRQRPDGLVVAVSPFFLTRANQIAAAAARHRLPSVFVRREFVAAGGLMSYGYDVADLYRQVGLYAGRILSGERPADLPIVQPSKFELVLNLGTAKAFGLTIPQPLLARADEVIE